MRLESARAVKLGASGAAGAMGSSYVVSAFRRTGLGTLDRDRRQPGRDCNFAKASSRRRRPPSSARTPAAEHLRYFCEPARILELHRHQHHRARGNRGSAERDAPSRLAACGQQAIDAPLELVAAADERGHQRRATGHPNPRLGRVREASCIGLRQTGPRDHPFVACHLALAVQCARHDDRRRVNPQHREQQRLREPRPVVARSRGVS